MREASIMAKARAAERHQARPASPPPQDDPAPPPEPEWPALDPAAYHGLAGRFVAAVEPASESDPVALLVQFLVAVGNAIGRTAHAVAEADRHYLTEYAVLVGQSARGRKGTSWGWVHRVLAGADPEWASGRVASGLSSGEGAIHAVRDPVEAIVPVKEKGKPVRFEKQTIDEGESDKRLLVLEPEYANVLKQTERTGNTLSAILRQAWETGTLRTLTKNSPTRATDAHISIIGHITAEELRRYLTATESANGFGNRFLWFAVRRSKLLPEGGSVDADALAAVVRSAQAALVFGRHAERIDRDDAARELWRAVYPVLSRDRYGLAGSLTGRAEAHVLRLSLLYAVLDLSTAVRPEHLAAAIALWEYCEASVRFVFGDSTGDPLADDLLALIRRSGDGITRSELREFIGSKTPADRIGRALGLLLRAGLARSETRETGGRPAELWFAAARGGRADG